MPQRPLEQRAPGAHRLQLNDRSLLACFAGATLAAYFILRLPPFALLLRPVMNLVKILLWIIVVSAIVIALGYLGFLVRGNFN